jgi:hypothetical protein
LAMLIIALVNWRYNPEFVHEMRQSFAISPQDETLGEFLFRKWLRRGK